MTAAFGKPWGIYIHIPFCRRKCAYCDFYSITDFELIPQYLEALYWEMKHYSKTANPVDSIYIGGGTPSALTAKEVENTLCAVHDYFLVLPDSEITFEANPESLKPEFLEKIAKAGINRLSIGAQSFDDKILHFLGRNHRFDQGMEAFNMARAVGFKNIGLDLIYGIPIQMQKHWFTTLQIALDCNPEHLSLYELTYETDTPLRKRLEAGEFHLLKEEQQRILFLETVQMVTAAGYDHYEISNFARNRYHSRHNSKYWNHSPYLGLGAAAHSFDGKQRWWNHSSVIHYISEASANIPPISGCEQSDKESRMLETLYFSFRTAAGLNLNRFYSLYGHDLAEATETLIDDLIERSWVKLNKGTMVPTLEGMLRADSLPLLWS